MNDTSTSIPTPPELPGEAAPSSCGVRTGDGDPSDPSYGIFAIVRQDDKERFHLLGTGFFITTTGLFITARHVLTAPFDSKGVQRFPISLIQIIRGNVWVLRPILRCAYHRVADIAVGVAAPMKNDKTGDPLRNPVLALTLEKPEIGTRVITFAYPRHANQVVDDVQVLHFMPAFYDGQVCEAFPNGRDRVLLPGPCYRTTINVHHGASGGPVFAPSGRVWGVNSTGIDGTDISYVSPIDGIFTLSVDDVVIDQGSPRSVPVLEIARAGHILVSPPL